MPLAYPQGAKNGWCVAAARQPSLSPALTERFVYSNSPVTATRHLRYPTPPSSTNRTNRLILCCLRAVCYIIEPKSRKSERLTSAHLLSKQTPSHLLFTRQRGERSAYPGHTPDATGSTSVLPCQRLSLITRTLYSTVTPLTRRMVSQFQNDLHRPAKMDYRPTEDVYKMVAAAPTRFFYISDTNTLLEG